VVHSGDFDYDDDPGAWDQQITDVLGPCYPYFASVGNHDDSVFYGPGGYQEMLAARLSCLGLTWDGDLGARSSHTYQGVLFVLTAPGVFGDGDADYAPYIRDQLAASDAIWRISSWHKLMEAMQVGGKSDDSGWDVYEESRRGGAVIATGHEHSYARTHPLRDCQNQVVDSVGSSFTIARDDPDTPADEGVTFVHHNGLGGRSIRDQERCLPTNPPYGCNGEWAAIYAEQQGANYGALFGVFNVGGNPRLAHFYFKDIDGNVVDEFHVEVTWGPCCPTDLDGDCGVGIGDVLDLLDAWGTDPGGPPDFDGDGAVAIRDFLHLLARWGPCP
ncbi:MAG: metallophosphoesterase family protein, partial [Planctomycetota bacterium]